MYTCTNIRIYMWRYTEINIYKYAYTCRYTYTYREILKAYHPKKGDIRSRLHRFFHRTTTLSNDKSSMRAGAQGVHFEPKWPQENALGSTLLPDYAGQACTVCLIPALPRRHTQDCCYRVWRFWCVSAVTFVNSILHTARIRCTTSDCTGRECR